MGADDKAPLEQAAAKALEDSGIPDAKLTLGKFLLSAGRKRRAGSWGRARARSERL